MASNVAVLSLTPRVQNLAVEEAVWLRTQVNKDSAVYSNTNAGIERPEDL